MKNKSELQHEVEQLNLTYQGTDTKEDLMDLLAVSHREHDVTGRPPLIPQYPVMLARKAKDLDNSKFNMILENKNGLWVAEEKLDGARAKLHLNSNGNRIDSRHRSDVTYEYVEKTNGLPHLKNMRHFISGTVLDGELIMPVKTIKDGKTDTDSQLTSTIATINSSPGRAIELQKKFGWCRFVIFDVLFYRGEDVRQLPYERRYKLLTTAKDQLPLPRCIRQPTRRVGQFVDFFKELVMLGGEGIMLKRLDWPYESRKRSKGWFKLPKQDRIDAFVTGFVPGEGEFSGLVGSLLVSVMVSDQTVLPSYPPTMSKHWTPVEIGAVQPGDLPFRNKISLADGSLDQWMYNQVVEVSYMCKTKNKRLRHAVLERFRPDKTMYDCTENI